MDDSFHPRSRRNLQALTVAACKWHENQTQRRPEIQKVLDDVAGLYLSAKTIAGNVQHSIRLHHGYLDDVFDVLDVHQHPCILLGRFALLWMGAAVCPSSNFDLLIRNSQIAAIAEDIPRTGNWEEAPLVCTFWEDYLQPPPRVFNRTDGTFSIKAPCCEVLTPVLLESDLHPGPEISAHKPPLLTIPNGRFLPNTHSQSASRGSQSKVYIPTISRYLDALLAQSRWLEENVDRGLCLYGPSVDVSYLIRYLFLEMPSQSRKILPLLESKSRMEDVLDRYKRTYKPRYRIKFKEDASGKKVPVLETIKAGEIANMVFEWDGHGIGL
ncbi:hypothetical protein F5887DRAFT_1285016 [Amanita rubescens]|nr:hypothetical protein F5887DRAFT_1285016 [Amanita rubescens]